MDQITLALAKNYTDEQIRKSSTGEVLIDKTLSKEGYAADAKAVGDALAKKQPIGGAGVYIGSEDPTDPDAVVWIDPDDDEVMAFLPQTKDAKVGQYLQISKVDDVGRIIEVVAVDSPSSGNSGMTTAQINALHEMFKVCLFDDTKDVDGAISAFETAFGITGGGEVPDQPEQPDQPGGGSGGTTADALPTNGLMAYFDLRNLGDKANVTVGTTKGVMATQGSGALFSWTDQPITSSDEYGVKTNRQMMFSAEGNTAQTDLGTEFTVISFGFGECIGPGIQTTNIVPSWQFMPSYNKTDGTAKADVTAGSVLNGDNMKDYNYAVYRVSGATLTLINDTSRKDYNGNDYEGFVSWDSKPYFGRTHYGKGYGTAVAIYNRALSDVEIEEARAFMKTLEVTA